MVWAVASNLRTGERKPDCRRLEVSGCEEVGVTSLSDSRSWWLERREIRCLFKGVVKKRDVFGRQTNQINNKMLQGLFVRFLICQINEQSPGGLCYNSKSLR